MKYRTTTLRTSLFVAALMLGTAAVNAEGQTPVPTPSNPGGSVQQQEMNRNNGPSGTMQGGPAAAGAKTTTGAAVANDPTSTTAGDPLKKSMDDPKQYGSPDKH